MRVRPLLFVAAGFICASTTVAIAQEASIYTFLEKTVGVFAVRVVAILPISGDQNHISGLKPDSCLQPH
jgi:hypothetical protein